MSKSKTSKGNGKSISKVEVKLDLSPSQSEELLVTLEARFEENPSRHKDMKWADVATRLVANKEKLMSLNAMEHTSGEPDVVGYDAKTDEYIFIDCSKQTPERRSICYDRKGEELREKKGLFPGGNAVDLAAAMGIELLNEAQYRELQEIGEFDTKTSSWIQTPADIRKLGGSLFADCRYGHVFVYHNSAQSFYSSRGFRGLLRV